MLVKKVRKLVLGIAVGTALALGVAVLYHFMLTRPHSVREDFALYVRSNSRR